MIPEKGLLSIAYLPPVQYFTKILLYKKILIEKYENYTKQTYRNRCLIYGANGILPLNIPVEKQHHQKTKIKDVRIDYNKKWQKLHWKGIESAYRSSPYYEFYIDDLAEFYSRKYTFLFDFNHRILLALLRMIELKAGLNFTTNFIPVGSGDYIDLRNLINPKKSFKNDIIFNPHEYNQVFLEKHGFIPNLSIIDLLFNEGPNTVEVLKKSINKEG